MSITQNAVASSSKRFSPSTSTPPTKRARPSSNKAESVHDDADDMSEDDVGDNEDEASRAKAARKEARTIRNRESAQRSRNQRKAHLAHLEQRVLALEAENRALRAGDTPPPARASSAERESSPAQSVISLAQDLGIPPEIVSSSGGVSLATVAPPPADLDVKPVIAASPTPVQLADNVSVNHLQAENAGLKERVGLLTNLVKQLFALANLDATSTVPAPTQVEPLQSVEWSAAAPTLSPNIFAAQPLQPPTAILPTPTLPSETEVNLACHPAVMVTRATPSRALQRARTPSLLAPSEMSLDRLEMVAKVVIQLAKLRGMTTCTLSTWNKMGTRTGSRRRLARCNRRQSARTTGMRR